MYEWIKWLHLSAGIVWLGGMTLMLVAVRPIAIAQLAPPERLQLMAAVLGRFLPWSGWRWPHSWPAASGCSAQPICRSRLAAGTPWQVLAA